MKRLGFMLVPQNISDPNTKFLSVTSSVTRELNPNLLGLPGGKFDATDISIVHTAVSKCFEQTGVSVDIDKCIHLYGGMVKGQRSKDLTIEDFFVDVFMSEFYDDCKLSTSEEVAWVTKEYFFKNCAFVEYNEKVFHAFEEFRKYEVF